ncbi:MAG: DUF2490 domain-containing protein [Novosphingobium sp.]|nr:DUF2490 domain-containing protein [Novosphingobium sp.]
MSPRAVLAAGLAATFALAAAPAHAADEDVQVWTAFTATVDASPRVVVWLEAQFRFTNDASRLGQTLLRPGIGYRFDANTVATLGYAYVPTNPPGPRFLSEHRIWEQLAFRIAGNGKGPTLTARTRLEQRFVEGTPGVGLRLRQQVRFSVPLAGKVRALAWTEPFVAFTTTQWGQRRGLDRLRSFGGLAFPVARKVTIEPGYINQWVLRPARDRVEHVGSLTVAARF